MPPRRVVRRGAARGRPPRVFPFPGDPWPSMSGIRSCSPPRRGSRAPGPSACSSSSSRWRGPRCVTVLPLTAYALFGSKETVSLVYTAVSLVALGFSFAIPMLVRRLSRRWTYTLGCALLGALRRAAGARRRRRRWSLGMLCRTAGAAILNVTLSLYIMDNIGKRELTRSEPLRLAVATLAWGVAPYRRRVADAVARASGRRRRSASPRSRCSSRSSGCCGWPRAGRSAPARGPAPPRHPLARDPPLRGAAAAAPRLGDRLRPLGVLDHLLHLHADPDGRGRAQRHRRRAGGGGGQPDALQQPLRPRAGPSGTRCAGCSARPSSPRRP